MIIKAFTRVLQNLDKLARSPGATRLFTSRSLTIDIQQCLIHLEHLQKKLDPEKRPKAMSRYGIRALKWTFESKELEKDLDVYGMFPLEDQWYQPHVSLIDENAIFRAARSNGHGDEAHSMTFFHTLKS